ncbi:probable trehalose-phosphate phosphatase 9-like isoform X1 [Zea mays]|uniref:Trehalose 6-phosphate phosphatase n=2 Tax=Zea mays TaxID=4577 RepID=A0A804LL60_MAIZE|nr:uncharacterized protein LOC100273093 isoform X1 [Zea mays]|eukprot:XP_020403315.1 uncharacterized protein LOC100273093 isoform X1 [Zea mays]
MTKHGVVIGPEDVAAARHFSFPPPRTAAGGESCRKLAAQVDLGPAVVGSWLDSMKASSPRHRLMAPVPGAADAEHDDWMERHPSALDRFDALAAAAKGKQVAVFLDYDGTLSPIVEDPDRAVMTDEMRDAVRGVAARFPTAIVSGRCRDKVFSFVRLAELYYAGSHGMDIRGPTADANHHHGNGKVYRRTTFPNLHHHHRLFVFPPSSHSRKLTVRPCNAPGGGGGGGGALPAGERVPAGDAGGVRGAGGQGGARHPGRQGGGQQVLPVGPLPLRGGGVLGRALRAGPRRAEGPPGPAPHPGPQGAGGPPHDPLGQGQGAGVPAPRPRLRRRRRPRRRLPHLRRRRPHRRGRLQGAARARARRRDPRVQVPQGHQRVLHATRPRRGQGVPAQARRRQRRQLMIRPAIRFPFPP